jgi:hypothetical protein
MANQVKIILRSMTLAAVLFGATTASGQSQQKAPYWASIEEAAYWSKYRISRQMGL